MKCLKFAMCAAVTLAVMSACYKAKKRQKKNRAPIPQES